MAIFTKYYDINVFSSGEKYSAKKDQRRFKIVDNQLAFLSDVVGDGVIEGWNILDEGTGSTDITYNPSTGKVNVEVESGVGLIDRFVVRTFGSISTEVNIDAEYNFYMQRKRNYLSSFSRFSDIATVTSPFHPATSSNFKPQNVTVSSVAYNQVILTWDSPNNTVDFDYYNVYRKTGSGSFELLDTTTRRSYTDSTVEEYTTYQYKIGYVNLSGNENQSSVVSLPDNGKTPYNSPPANPTNVIIYRGNTYVQLVWRQPPRGNVDYYRINVYQTGVLVHTATTSNLSYIITGLTNSISYSVELKAVSPDPVPAIPEASRSSSGIDLSVSARAGIDIPEVSNVRVTESQSAINTTKPKLTVTWDYDDDTFTSDYFKITIIVNGNTHSDPIIIENDFSGSFSIDVENFKLPSGIGVSFTRSVEEETYYVVKVQAVNDEEEETYGKLWYVTTSDYTPPGSVIMGEPTVTEDRKIVFTWSPSNTDFDHYVITAYSANASTGAVLSYLTDDDGVNYLDYNYGKVNSFTVDNPGNVNLKFVIKVKTVDSYSQESSIATAEKLVDFTTLGSLGIPTNQYILNGNGYVYLSWKDNYHRISSTFKVWRALHKTEAYEASDFSLIATVPSPITEYWDYDVDPGVRYIYFVTVTDIFGRESLNPADDSFMTYPYLRGFPTEDETFNRPSNVTVSASNFDANLSWNIIDDDYDGIEIYRSSDKVSWEKAGYVAKGVTSFTDANALLVENSTYYYMVRKYRDEGRIVYTTISQDQPVDSVLLGTVSTDGGALYVTDQRTILSDVADVIADYVTDEVNDHDHQNKVVDRRIDLRENIIIENWTTTDRRVYTTTEEIDGATLYEPYVNGSLSSVFYEVDTTNKKIVFAEVLPSNAIVTLRCYGLSETQGELEAAKVQPLDASLIKNGQLNKLALPDISHEGRNKEQLIPLQVPLDTVDGYNFTINDDNQFQTMGGGLSFYDIINTDANTLVAATSNGIYKSTDSGESWNLSYSTIGVVHTIRYIYTLDKYFALGAETVYISDNGLNWTEMSGIDAVSSIREIIDDGTNVFLSTDLGVYALTPGTSQDLLIWDQKALPTDLRDTTSCFGLWYDSVSSRLYVSTERQIIYTADSGDTWTVADSLYDGKEPIYQFKENGSYIYGISDMGVWRKEIAAGSWSLVLRNQGNSARKLIVFDDGGTDRIIINSDKGLLVSKTSYNIETANDIECDIINSLKDSVLFGDITALYYDNAILYIGSDKKLYSGSTIANLSLLYTKTGNTTPTFYINGEEKKIGVWFSNINNKAYFDRRVFDSDEISVANNYTLFRAKNGGWVGQDYTSSMKIYKSGFTDDPEADSQTISGPSASTVQSGLNEADFSVLDSTNSYYSKVTTLSTQYSDIVDSIDDEDGPETCGEACRTYREIFAQVYDEYKYFALISVLSDYTIVGNLMISDALVSTYFSDLDLVPEIPSVKLLPSPSAFVISIDISTGIVNTLGGLDKYDRIYIDLTGTALYNDGTLSHEALEDSYNKAFFGLPKKMDDSFVTNKLLLSDFIQDRYGGLTKVDSNNIVITSQSDITFIDPITSSDYDNLNSSVDYSEVQSNSIEEFNVTQVTSVVYDSDSGKVLVGHLGGLLTINTSNYEKNSIDFNREYFAEKVIDIVIYDSTIYVATESSVNSTSDLSTWNIVDMTGVSGNIRRFSISNGNMFAVTSSGIYYKGSIEDSWTLVNGYAFNAQAILHDNNRTILSNYSGHGSYIRYTNNGKSWSLNADLSVNVIGMSKFANNVVLATDHGLRYDNGSFSTTIGGTSLVDVLSDPDASALLRVNDVVTKNDDTEYVFGLSNGKYYVYDGVFNEHESDLDCVHKVLYVGSDYWLFGFGSYRVSSESEPYTLSFAKEV